VDEIVGVIVQEFEVSQEAAARDVGDFVRELLAKSLVTRVS